MDRSKTITETAAHCGGRLAEFVTPRPSVDASGRPLAPVRTQAEWLPVVAAGALVVACLGSAVASQFDRVDGSHSGFVAGLLLGGWVIFRERQARPLLALLRRCERYMIVAIGLCSIRGALAQNIPEFRALHSALILGVFVILIWVIMTPTLGLSLFALVSRARHWLQADVIDQQAGLDATIGVWALGMAMLGLLFGDFPITPVAGSAACICMARAWQVDRRQRAFVASVVRGRSDWVVEPVAPAAAEWLRIAKLRGRSHTLFPTENRSRGPYRARPEDAIPIMAPPLSELKRAVNRDALLLVCSVAVILVWLVIR